MACGFIAYLIFAIAGVPNVGASSAPDMLSLWGLYIAAALAGVLFVLGSIAIGGVAFMLIKDALQLQGLIR